MNKIRLIIGREYLTRVRKKSFIVMTIVGPILMVVLMLAPMLLLMLDESEVKTIAIADKSKQFQNEFKDSKDLKFVYVPNDSIEQIKSNLSKSDYYALLILPENVEKDKIELLSGGQPDIATETTIEKTIENKLQSEKLEAFGIDKSKLDSTNADVKIKTIKVQSDGSENVSSTGVIMAIGFIAGLTIYMFIFIYGSQVMRGVLEEKTNRVVEVLVSSVKPFELMMGKVVGIALVALTQVALWVILTTAIIAVIQPILGVSFGSQMAMEAPMNNEALSASGMPAAKLMENELVQDVFHTLMNLPIFEIFFSFIFFFLGGYLLYSSLFAAIGSAVDNETDTQQFMLPITVPLILAILVAQTVMKNPDGAIAFWFSIIPFTSPIVMLVRVPFGVPVWELLLSMFLLIMTFIGTIWLAGKIYRVGILMYGKKVNYKELWKWLRY